MVKKGPLSKVETFYIDQHHEDLSVSQIAEDLNRAEKSVENYIKKQAKIKTQKTTNITAGDHFIRNNGAVVMTENASTLADAKRRVINRHSPGCITKIRTNE